jgi:ATP-dependent DNA ligase
MTASLFSPRCRRRFREGRSEDLSYFVFDLLFDVNEDVRRLPLAFGKSLAISSVDKSLWGRSMDTLAIAAIDRRIV